MSDEIIKRDDDSALDIHIDEHKRLGSKLIQSLRQNAEDTGSRILQIANARAEKWFTEEVIRQVEELVRHRNQLLINVEKANMEVVLTEKRLAAIERGEFKIGWNGRILFTDGILNFG